MEQMQNETKPGSYEMPMGDEEAILRQRYLRQPNETKEQREQRNANVRRMLKESRDATIGVKNESVLSSFSKGRGAE